MRWEILGTDEFAEWYGELTEAQQQAVNKRIELLELRGPNLGEPAVKRIVGSRLHAMKELRVSQEGALRILFVFDPARNAVLLLGGDKTGAWESWYRLAIPQAEVLYDDYLERTGQRR